MVKNLFRKIYAFLTVKVLLLLIVITVIPLAIYFTIEHYKKNREHEKIETIILKNEEEAKIISDSISKVKVWKELDYSPEIGIKNISLKTKYMDGMVYYSFNCFFSGKNKLPSDHSYNNKLAIHFLDKDDFDIYEIEIPLNDITYTFADGKRIGINMDSKVQISKEKYIKFIDWNLSWQF